MRMVIKKKDERIRAAVKKRIEDFKLSGLHSYLNDPITASELNSQSAEPSLPLALLVPPRDKKDWHRDPNRDLIYELLVNGATIPAEAILFAVHNNDVATTLLLLHYGVPQNLITAVFRTVCLGNRVVLPLTQQKFKIMKLLLSYKAEINSKDEKGETALFELTRRVVEFYWFVTEEKYTKMINLILSYGANPYIKNVQGKSCFDLINECKDAQRNPVDAKLNLKPLPTSEQTQKELNELAALLNKAVDNRIERMTDFLHTRASQTPFTVKDLAKKIAEHVYKDDMHVSRQDWDKLVELVKK